MQPCYCMFSHLVQLGVGGGEFWWECECIPSILDILMCSLLKKKIIAKTGRGCNIDPGQVEVKPTDKCGGKWWKNM